MIIKPATEVTQKDLEGCAWIKLQPKDNSIIIGFRGESELQPTLIDWKQECEDSTSLS